jgi:hypothetical protein
MAAAVQVQLLLVAVLLQPTQRPILAAVAAAQAKTETTHLQQVAMVALVSSLFATLIHTTQQLLLQARLLLPRLAGIAFINGLLPAPSRSKARHGSLCTT